MNDGNEVQAAMPAPVKRRGPRGEGRLFHRGSIWYVAYCRNGHEIRESADTTDETKARKFLRQRIEEAKRPEFVGPKEKRLELNDLQRKIEADYIRHGRRSWETVKHCLKPVKKYFAYARLLEITPLKVEAYQDHRLKQGMARATVNREVRYLLHGYRLLVDAGEISYAPRVKLLEGENVREGFLHVADFEAAAAEIQNDDTRDAIRFCYYAAWRSGEVKKLEWSKFDHNDFVFRLPRKSTKNKRPRTLVLVGELKEIILRRLAKRLPQCPFVFHREGKQIKSFLKAFRSACGRAGLELPDGAHLVPHDMRRSGVRNLRRSGNDEKDCMEVSGHETRSTFDRYDICDEDDQRRALEKQEEYRRAQLEQGRKVVPIRKAG
jgi:integrase